MLKLDILKVLGLGSEDVYTVQLTCSSSQVQRENVVLVHIAIQEMAIDMEVRDALVVVFSELCDGIEQLVDVYRPPENVKLKGFSLQN